MPVIKFNGQQFALQPGQNRLGGGTTADVALNGAQGVLAVVDLGADGRAIIRKAGNENIRVNGTPLDQPTPLIHGDKVEITGNEIFFADDVKQGGSTQFVSAADVAAIANAKRSGPARGTLNTGGRLVLLGDGKGVPHPGSRESRSAATRAPNFSSPKPRGLARPSSECQRLPVPRERTLTPTGVFLER